MAAAKSAKFKASSLQRVERHARKQF